MGSYKILEKTCFRCNQVPAKYRGKARAYLVNLIQIGAEKYRFFYRCEAQHTFQAENDRFVPDFVKRRYGVV